MIDWGNTDWGKPGHNVHTSDTGSELDAEGRD